jgi:hypothetical protein
MCIFHRGGIAQAIVDVSLRHAWNSPGESPWAIPFYLATSRSEIEALQADFAFSRCCESR